ALPICPGMADEVHERVILAVDDELPIRLHPRLRHLGYELVLMALGFCFDLHGRHIQAVAGRYELQAGQLAALANVIDGVDLLAGLFVKESHARPKAEDGVEDGPEAVGDKLIAVAYVLDGRFHKAAM